MAEQVVAIIRWMTTEAWTAKRYRPLSKNCNYFCKDLPKNFGARKVPYSVSSVPRFCNLVTPGVLCVPGCASGMACPFPRCSHSYSLSLSRSRLLLLSGSILPCQCCTINY